MRHIDLPALTRETCEKWRDESGVPGVSVRLHIDRRGRAVLLRLSLGEWNTSRMVSNVEIMAAYDPRLVICFLLNRMVYEVVMYYTLVREDRDF